MVPFLLRRTLRRRATRVRKKVKPGTVQSRFVGVGRWTYAMDVVAKMLTNLDSQFCTLIRRALGDTLARDTFVQTEIPQIFDRKTRKIAKPVSLAKVYAPRA
jgi:hypothetical protein